MTGLTEQLEVSGAVVEVTMLENLREGFWAHERPPNTGIAESGRLAEQLMQKWRHRHVLEPHDGGVRAGIGAEHRGRTATFETRPPAPAPALRARDLAGQPRTLADYRGKAVLLNFWASWCPPCLHEMPSIGRLRG